MDKTTNELEDLFVGLSMSAVDARTYSALLAHGSLSIRKLAQITNINRGTTYEALKRLTAVGLVSVRAHSERERFLPESPEKLLVLIRDKRRELLELGTTAKQLVPSLLAGRRQASAQPLVRYYEDDEGIVTILHDVLETCRQLTEREYYAYSTSAIRQYLYRRFPSFTTRRIADEISVKVIAVGKGGENAELSERKWLPDSGASATSSYTLIYGNKLATISIAANDTPYGVVIEDAGAAALQRLLFEQLWIKLN